MAKLYAGNLPYTVTENDLRTLFQEHGFTPLSIKMITDRETGNFRGFGFVEIDDASANQAIDLLHEKEFGGRRLVLNVARPKGESSGPRTPYAGGGGNFSGAGFAQPGGGAGPGRGRNGGGGGGRGSYDEGGRGGRRGKWKDQNDY